jgi:hypothetical protein
LTHKRTVSYLQRKSPNNQLNQRQPSRTEACDLSLIVTFVI